MQQRLIAKRKAARNRICEELERPSASKNPLVSRNGRDLQNLLAAVPPASYAAWPIAEAATKASIKR
jgi:hypothetical protein